MAFFNLKEKHAVVISPASIMFAVLFILGLYFLYVIQSIIILLFLAFIIMTALRPFVLFLRKRLRVPRALAILLTYLVVLGLFVLLVGLVVPPLANQLYQLVRTIDLPYFQDEIRNLTTDLNQLGQLVERIGSSFNVVMSVISSTFAGVFTFFTLLVMSIYMMIDRPNLHKKIVWFTREPKHLEMAKTFINDVEGQLGGWVRGQTLLMLTIGVLTYVGLLLLNIPYALPLAILAGFLEIVPNLGPTIAAIPAVIAGYVVGGPIMAGVMVLFYIILQQFENNLIVPKIMQENADVNPLVSITVILIGLEVGGVIGALLGVPIYIVLRASYAAYRRHNG